MFLLISILGIGAVSAFAGGVFGLGGGFLLVPLLTLQMKMDIHTAIFFSLIALFWMSLLKVIAHRDIVESQRKLILKLALMTILGSALSAVLAAKTPSNVLNILFALVLIGIAIYFYRDRHWDAHGAAASKKDLQISRLIFFMSGMMGGLLGLGGGLFNIPAMHKFMKLPIHLATKLNFPFIFISASTALVVTFQANADEIRALPVPPVLAMLVGTTLGSHFSSKVKVSSKNLKTLFAVILAILGIIKIYKSI